MVFHLSRTDIIKLDLNIIDLFAGSARPLGGLLNRANVLASLV